MQVQFRQIQQVSSTLEEEKRILAVIEAQLRQLIALRKQERNIKESKKQFLDRLEGSSNETNKKNKKTKF